MVELTSMTRETVGESPTGATERVDIDCIAHRGFAGIYPENTLTAMRAASAVELATGPADVAGAQGVDSIEIDVLPAAGGEPVVFHDLTLGRLTDVHPNQRGQMVWETPLETLGGLSVLDSGESVPTLAAVMEVIPSHVQVNVELKHPGTGEPRRELNRNERPRGRNRWAAFTERVLCVLSGYDHELLVASSYEGALAAMRDIAPSVPLAYLFWNSIEGGMEITRRYDCEAVHPSLDMLAGTSLFNSGYVPTGPFSDIDVVERVHEEGRAVNVWTVTTRQQAVVLERAGVDGLITDYPSVFDSVRRPEQAIEPDPEEQVTPDEQSSNAASGD